MKKIVLSLFAVMVLLCGCGNEKAAVKSITKEELIEKMNSNNSYLIDVRSDFEYNSGHLGNAINIDVNVILELKSEMVHLGNPIPKDAIVILYCRSGTRSKKAADKLIELGYKNVYDFGSMDNWG